MMDLNVDRVDLETYEFDVQVKTSKPIGEIIEFIVVDKNATMGTKIEYGDGGEALEVPIYPQERISFSPFRRVPLEDGSVRLDEKTSEEAMIEIKENARRKFFAKYSALNSQKDFPEGTIVFEGPANE